MFTIFLRFIVVLSVCTFTVNAFFDFLKTSGAASTSVQVPQAISTDIDHFRGIPDNLRAKYEQEVFTCDNGQTKLSSASVNDGYCDCADHSDEPGTSACIKGTFHCINKGYKTIVIPSSRVDDQICDCCDGSDEGIYVKCPDTCKEVAANERSATEKLIQAYKIGNNQRKALEDKARSKLEQEANLQTISPGDIEEIRQQIANLEGQINSQENIITEKENRLKEEVKNKLNRLLKFNADADNLSYLANFLSALTRVLNLDDIQLSNYLSDSPPIPSRRTTTTTPTEEHYDDYEFRHEDEEAIAAVTPPTPTNDVIDTCDITDLTGNSNLRVLCDATNKPASIIAMLHSIMLDHKPYNELILISGYQRLYQTFNGVEDFIKKQIEINGNNDLCPVEFEPLQNFCQTKEILIDFITRIDSISSQGINKDNDEDYQRIQQLKQQKNDLAQRITDSENIENAVKRAKEQLQEYENRLAFLAVKGETYEVRDGKFSYSVTMLENVRQKEIDGYNSVSLGEYESIEESDDHGFSYKMKFRNGQYCHAFGPRSAEVTIVCGVANALKSAAEPSTCFYKLLLESPVACKEEFAAANGLLV